MKKYYRMQCQTEFLLDCRYNLVIPKGINNQCQFSLSYDNTDVQTVLSNMFQITKSRAFDTIIIDYQNTLKRFRRELYAQTDLLKQYYNTSEIDNILSIFNSYFVPINNKLRQNHQKKLSDLLKQKDNFKYYEPNSEIVNNIQSVNQSKKKNRKFSKRKKTNSRLNKKTDH